MTTNEASIKFKIDAKTITKLCREKYVLNAYKNRIWIIPDDTKVIMDKQSILYVLWQIINLKNNLNYAAAHKYIDTIDKTKECLNYFVNMGFITKFDEQTKSIDKMLMSTMLTSSGMDLLFDLKGYKSNITKCLFKNFSIITITGVSL